MIQTRKYTNVAMSLHWIMAILIFILLCLGWYMEDLPKGSDERSYFFALHKSLGLTAALFLILRILWRVFNTPPDLPLTIKGQYRKLATITHHSLYLLMVLQPLTGYLSSSFSGYKTKFWNVIVLPQWAEKSKELNEFFTSLHEINALLLTLCIAIHIAGAFAFLYLNHDNVLSRMVPGKK